MEAFFPNRIHIVQKLCVVLFSLVLPCPHNWALIYLFTFKGRHFYIIHWFTRIL